MPTCKSIQVAKSAKKIKLLLRQCCILRTSGTWLQGSYPNMYNQVCDCLPDSGHVEIQCRNIIKIFRFQLVEQELFSCVNCAARRWEVFRREVFQRAIIAVITKSNPELCICIPEIFHWGEGMGLFYRRVKSSFWFELIVRETVREILSCMTF